MVLLKLNDVPTPTLADYKRAAEPVSPDAPVKFEVIVKKELRVFTAPAAK